MHRSAPASAHRELVLVAGAAARPTAPLDLAGIAWVIVGGESGKDARPTQAEWVRDIRDQCQQADVPFLFKQWGGRTPKVGGQLLDGQVWDQFPANMVNVEH